MEQNNNHIDCGCGGACAAAVQPNSNATLYRLAASVAILMIGGGLDLEWLSCSLWQESWLRLLWYLAGFFVVAMPLLREGWELFRDERSWCNEITLMVFASLGAFYIGEYPEALLLVILYTMGEILQARAVQRARRNISALIDMRPTKVTIVCPCSGCEEVVAPQKVEPGTTLRLKVGDRLPLDGELLSKHAILDMSALTGESLPVERAEGDLLLAGSIVVSYPIEVKSTAHYDDSTLAKILRMVEEASDRKSPTESFIRRFARIYTPLVVALAVAIVLVPWILSLITAYSYDFTSWFYRALVFLVTSCPCALVISVPLTYFAGIGAASRMGLLIKGSNFLDKLRSINAFAFDKTGTVTQGTFEVTNLEVQECAPADTLALLRAIEEYSSHPLAIQVVRYLEQQGIAAAIEPLREVTEIAGRGITAQTANGEPLLVGNAALMQEQGVSLQLAPKHDTRGSVVYVAHTGQLVAVITLRDTLRLHAQECMEALRQRGIEQIELLSGDQPESVQEVAQSLSVDKAHGALLPQEKVVAVEQLLHRSARVAFVGDGINDAPVMAVSDVGIAMGGVATDAALEAADVVLQRDDLMLLPRLIDLSKRTYAIVIQNIVFALAFKVVILLLATLGMASLTLAILADVGVCLLTVVNALRNIR